MAAVRVLPRCLCLWALCVFVNLPARNAANRHIYRMFINTYIDAFALRLLYKRGCRRCRRIRRLQSLRSLEAKSERWHISKESE